MEEIRDSCCPCEAVQRLTLLVERQGERLDDHDRRLERGSIDFAVINTKLNIVMAVLSAVGVAVCGAVVALLF